MTAEFVFDSMRSISDMYVTFRCNNDEEEWKIPLFMFDILLGQHDVSTEEIRLQLDVNQVHITLVGEDNVTARVVLSLSEVQAFYHSVVRSR